MLLKDGAITHLAEAGQITLQVPSLYTVNDLVVDYPQEWFMEITKGRLCIGREEGFLFLSPLGWEKNKDVLQKAYVSRNPANDWAPFEQHAKSFFQSVQSKTEKHAKSLQEKVNQANARIAQIFN